ncbi:MAG: hypothetical protein KatS3mg054_0564 [Chloroflexus sp.]|nr:MAG: hypothetical protein KatS3mg054_0564 [Chloroflexus sp.]GIV91717.1 MAG: hypothetical protein KatS3mg056_0426 [Chloroflexus sp.]
MTNPRTNYALAGAALFNPMAAMYWLDVMRGQRPGVGLLLVSTTGAVCAGLAAEPRRNPWRALASGLAAAAGAALAGWVLRRYVDWVSEAAEVDASAPNAHDLLLPAAAVCAGTVGLSALVGREPGRYIEYSGKHGDYRWISAIPHPAQRWLAWSGYLLHQFAIWGCIYAAQHRRLPYTAAMKRLNWIALAVNAGGVALHYLQSHYTYDGLARDVPEGSALGSVAFILMLTLALESPRRGLFFGSRRVLPPPELVRFARRFHGYIFSWASTYNFWYHPIDPKPLHYTGLFHTLLLFVQSALIYTKAHRDPRWTLALELMVLPHAVVSTLYKRSGLGAMFTFSLLAMFVINQMHGLGLSQRARWTIGAAYATTALTYYGVRREWHRLPDILRIPILEYGVLGILVLLSLLMRAVRRSEEQWRANKT